KYTTSPDGLRLLQDKLIEAAKMVTPTRSLIKLAQGQSYESEAVVPGDDDSFYSFAIRDLQIGQKAARFRLEVFRYVSNDQRELAQSKDHLLRLEQMESIPSIPRVLRLDGVFPDRAEFCVCDPAPPET